MIRRRHAILRALVALGVAVAAGTWAVGCGNEDSVGPPPPPPPPGPPIVSDPVPIAAGSAGASFSVTGTADIDVAYVALPPGSAPEGRLATISNRRSGDSIVVAVSAGGFDPAAIGAVAGDNIAIVVHDDLGNVVFQPPLLVVVARRPPIVVRTNPPPRKRDVPLNSQIVIVFSEPVDSVTLSGSAVQLRQGSTVVPGHVEFRNSDHVTALFIPANPLQPSTPYTFDVSRDVRDLDGEALEAAVTVEFTTAASLSYEEYFVDATAPLSVDQVGDSVVVRFTVLVMNGNGDGIEGATTRFRSSIGSVEPQTTTSGLGGVTVGQWRFAGIVGVLPAQATAELSACASNSTTRCDMYWTQLLIGYNPP